MSQQVRNEKLRNIAIIAHVDHGKTTLVDHMLRQSGTFRDNQDVEDRIMDSMDLERERGITISAKNCSVYWKDVKINILDTPGHADFGGEVERALTKVDGVALLVDSSEGPLPQTRYVLGKALEKQLKVIVVINKIDRSDSRPQEVLDEIYDLFIDLDADEDMLEFPVLYATGRDGLAKFELEDKNENLNPLFDTIVDQIPPPAHDPGKPFQMRVADLDYSDYLGRLAVGRIWNGAARLNDNLVCINKDNDIIPLKVAKLKVYDGLKLSDVEEAEPGDIITLAGIDNVHIGDTICTKEDAIALPRIEVDEPTVSMKFTINTSPFSGREGAYVQSNKLRDRLLKETLRNVAIQVEETEDKDRFLVKGRGEFQLAILIETIRRENYEFCVGRPHVIYKYDESGQKLEPIEHLQVDCAEEVVGIVTEKLSRRKGAMSSIINHSLGRVRVEYSVPSRALIGYLSQFLTDTKGTGLMNSYLEGYEAFRGNFLSRTTGSLVADRAGQTMSYALSNLEQRGKLFVNPGEEVYEGMIVGEHNRDNDLNVNATKAKKLTNIRAAGKDDSIMLTTVKPMTVERAIDFIRDDELVEVTPKNIRLRKTVLKVNERPRV